MHRRKKTSDKPGDPMLIPFMNMVCLLIPFLLLSATFVSYGMINVNAPHFIPGPVTGDESREKELNLTVFVTDRGITVSARGEFIPAQGQAADVSGKSGPTVPMKRVDGKMDYDYEALAAKLRELKDENEGETQIKLGAEADISYNIIVDVMDASREDDKGPLFPDVVMLGAFI
ncbi:MAG: biopolymer transporter ExbD [Pseudomonadota bacterium]